jgi:hypothetical protein
MGTEAFWVPALLAAAGTGANYVNTKNANSRQQAGEAQSIIDQMKLQSQGNSQVKALTSQIAQDTPTQLAAKSTGDFVSNLRKNAAGTQSGGSGGSSILFGAPTSSLPTDINAGSRYKTGAANAQTQTQQYGNELAGEMGQINGATLQRQNEGLAQGTLGTNLNMLGAQSYTQNFADQLRSQAAGQSNPWLTLLGGVLSGAGSAMSKNGAPSKTVEPNTNFDGSTLAPSYSAPAPGYS